MSTVKIASVHFHALSLRRPNYGGIYDAPAVVPGGEPVFVMQTDNVNGKIKHRDGCTDKVCIERGGFTQSGIEGVRSIQQTLVRGEEIAPDLVNEWTKLDPFSKTEPPCYPGVWVVRDRLPELDEDGKSVLDAEGRQAWRDATDEEKKAMWDEDVRRCRLADSNYARAIFDHWNAVIEQHPDFVKTLPIQVRKAAEVYGFTAEWLRESTVTEMKACQFCDKRIRKSTIVCPHCREIVDYERYAAEKKKREDVFAKHGVTVDAVIAGVSGPPPSKPGKAA